MWRLSLTTGQVNDLGKIEVPKWTKWNYITRSVALFFLSIYFIFIFNRKDTLAFGLSSDHSFFFSLPRAQEEKSQDPVTTQIAGKVQRIVYLLLSFGDDWNTLEVAFKCVRNMKKSHPLRFNNPHVHLKVGREWQNGKSLETFKAGSKVTVEPSDAFSQLPVSPAWFYGHSGKFPG